MAVSERRLLELIGEIDDDLIEGAADYSPKKRRAKKTLIISLVAAAACLVVAGALIFMMPGIHSRRSESKSPDIIPVDQPDSFRVVPNSSSSYLTTFIPESKVVLQIDDITDTQIVASYIVTSSEFEDEFYTYDGFFQLMRVGGERTATFDYYAEYRSPVRQPSDDMKHIDLDSPETVLIFDYADEYGPLVPGDYYLFGYIYSNEGSGVPIWVTAQFTVPES